MPYADWQTRAVTDLDGAINSAIEQIRTLDTESAALDLATRTFGAEGAARLVAAIRDGAIPAVSELGTEFGDAAGSLIATQREVTTWADLASASWGRVVGAVGGLFDLSPPDWLTSLLFEGRLSDLSIEIDVSGIGALDLATASLPEAQQHLRGLNEQIGLAERNITALQDSIDGGRLRLEPLKTARANLAAATTGLADLSAEAAETQARIDELTEANERAADAQAEAAAAQGNAAIAYQKQTDELRKQLATLPTVAERVRRLQVQHRLSARNAELDARAQQAFRDALEVVTLAARPAFVALDDTSEAAERLRRANEPLASTTLDLGDAYANAGAGRRTRHTATEGRCQSVRSTGTGRGGGGAAGATGGGRDRRMVRQPAGRRRRSVQVRRGGRRGG